MNQNSLKYSLLILPLLMFLIILHSCSNQSDETIVLVGGTILDLSLNGHSEKDLSSATIVIEGSKISAVTQGELPDTLKNSRIIDCSDKYIVPGLIDGFATINNQAYANAYLYMGITSIIAVGGGRRGGLYLSANPGPNIYLLGDVGFEPCTDAELGDQIETEVQKGIDVLLLMYKLRPEQTILAVKMASQFGIATIGELGYTSYVQGMRAGVDAFVHITRYSLDAVPQDLRMAVAENPFSDDLTSPKWKYYKYLSVLDTNDRELLRYSRVLGEGNIYLMPTLSLLYLDLPDSKNPWLNPVTAILDPWNINNPADRITGKHTYDQAHLQAYKDLAVNELGLGKVYYQSGAKHLAGSATDVWGTMPGISLHTELKLLSRIGLTNREVIAAATANFADAFGWQHTGEIKAGRDADILILDTNPIKDLNALKKIHLLLLQGKIIDRHILLN